MRSIMDMEPDEFILSVGTDAEIRREYTNLIEACKQQQATIQALQAKVDALEAAAMTVPPATPQPASEPLWIEWDVFCKSADAKWSTTHWMGIVAYGCDTPYRLLSAYSVTGWVPSSLYEDMMALDGDDVLPAARQHWTFNECKFVWNLVRWPSISSDHKRERLEIAKLASAQFGRRIFETSINRLIARLKRDGW